MGYYGLGPGHKVAEPLSPLEKALRMMPLAQAEATLEILEKLCRNTAQAPTEEKFRRIRLSNEKIKAVVADVPGGTESLLEMGWVPEEDCLVLPKGVKLTMHEHVGKIIDAKQHYKKETEKAKKADSSRMKELRAQAAVGAA